MSNTYICPECRGKIRYYDEVVIVKTQKINSKTGALSKRIYKTEVDNDLSGFKCEDCTWCVNDIHGDVPDFLKGWHDDNEKDLKL